MIFSKSLKAIFICLFTYSNLLVTDYNLIRFWHHDNLLFWFFDYLYDYGFFNTVDKFCKFNTDKFQIVDFYFAYIFNKLSKE